MSKLRVHCFSVSLDGYSAGPNQDLSNPVGVGGLPVFGWQFATRTHHRMHGTEGGVKGLDDDMVTKGFEGIGAWIIGRNTFGPVRGPWLDDSWKGWWGDNPVYHTPVFVLNPSRPQSDHDAGGTTFHFITDGIHTALDRAKEAANGKDVRLGGGISTMKQYLRAGLVDDMHFVVSPALIGFRRTPVSRPESACSRV